MSEERAEYKAILELASAWASVKKSSSKDGGIGYEYGYSDPTGDVASVLHNLKQLKQGVEALLVDRGDAHVPA